MTAPPPPHTEASPASSQTRIDRESTTNDVEKPQEDSQTSTPKDPHRRFPVTWQTFVPFTAPRKDDLPPPYESLDQAEEIPLKRANIVNQLFFAWIAPIVALGYRRVLTAEDLWKLDESRQASPLADKLIAAYDKQDEAVNEYNARLEAGDIKKKWYQRKAPEKRKPTLLKPILRVFGLKIVLTSVIKVLADGLQTTSPFVTKALIQYGSSAYYAHRGQPVTEEPFGRGLGLAFGLFGMVMVSNFLLNTFMARSMQEGVLIRAAIIAAVSRRSMRLSGKSRAQLPNSRIISLISSDLSRIDFACGFAPLSWTGTIQLIVCIIILIVQLGVSSLAGIAFLFALLPFQLWGMAKMFRLRQKTAFWTDKRVKLISELLNGIKIIKFFSWEQPNIDRIDHLRRQELVRLRGLIVIRAAFQAIAISMPTLAAVVAFLTFAGIGRTQDPAIIFTSLSLFNLLRMPLMMLPLSLSAITDAAAALGRINEVMCAEKLAKPFDIDPKAEHAILVKDAEFQWETSEPVLHDAGKSKAKPTNKAERKEKTAAKKEKQAADKKVAAAAGADGAKGDPTEAAPALLEPFKLTDINLKVGRGELIAVVGAVGSGKSSLLAALIGEMRRLKGDITFQSSIAFCSQTAWIQNATLKDNILFGQAFDPERYQRCIQDACLEPDLDILPNGDMTEIGEKGINLSGGQRQRVGIARALYYDADIFFFDDPLSAVDAHVGTWLFERAINGALSHKTRILVTHALHVLPQVDRILVMANGTISEDGTYDELVARQGPFSEFAKSFAAAEGSKDGSEESSETDAEKDVADELKVQEPPMTAEEEGLAKEEQGEDMPKPAGQGALMQQEERSVGSVPGKVYMQFIKAAKGHIMVPIVVLTLLLSQAAQVLASYWLVWWQQDQFNEPQGFYMAIYAGLGVSQAIGLFLMGAAAAFFGYNASKSLHFGAARRVLLAPMSYFDTTPLGRIVSRFAKDVDTIDNTLNDSFRMALSTFGQVLGAVVIVAIVNQWFLIPLAVIAVFYARALKYYRSGARQVKQLDNLLRSALYAHFSESLSGITTIRAYGEDKRFLRNNEAKIDIQDRAYILSIYNQRWLAIRLDILGSLLVLVVAIISVTERYDINPSQIGLILSTIIGVTASLTWMIRQLAEVENDMNSSERLLYYRNELDQEAPQEIEATKPPSDWPSRGHISFENIQLRYRPGLPLVLKGLTLEFKAGEKIGVVGRTGAGKSSILSTLLRIIEPAGGRVVIDGVDTQTIGLHDLRTAIAMIPQEALLFNGTIRSNLDPFETHDDAALNDALRCAYLADRYNLDSPVEDEGSNFSVGERSLVSLARALVKDSRIVCLDEATSSVDLETDSRIQTTIRKEFVKKTLITIAHRLRTVLSYDRILVMDQGNLAEFASPLELYQQPNGIFRSMCEASNITAEDIVTSQENRPEAAISK